MVQKKEKVENGRTIFFKDKENCIEDSESGILELLG